MDKLYVNCLHAKKIPSHFGFKRFYLQTKLPSSNKREDSVIYSDTDELHKGNVNNRHVFRSSRPPLLQHLHVHPKRFLDGVFGDETDKVCGVGFSVCKKFVYCGFSHHGLTYLTGMICREKNAVVKTKCTNNRQRYHILEQDNITYLGWPTILSWSQQLR